MGVQYQIRNTEKSHIHTYVHIRNLIKIILFGPCQKCLNQVLNITPTF